MQQVQENKMGTMPVLRLLLGMSVPSIISMLIHSLYNIVDSVYVSMLGEEALTAVTLAFPIQMLMIAFATGTGVGVSSLISRRLGQRMQKQANDAATHGLILNALSSLLFVAFGLYFSEGFLRLFSQNEAVISMGIDYLSVVTVYCSMMFVEIMIGRILQATGNMLSPMLFMLAGAVTNIILDPIMIFGLLGFPALGVRGAAVATVIGQAVSLLFALCVLIFKKHDVKISFKRFRIKFKTIGHIYAVGLPTVLMQSLTSVMTTGLNAILVGFSETAVSVLGIYFRLQSFVFMPIFGLTQGTLPVIGYNYGAGNKDRLLCAFGYACAIAVGIMAVGMSVFQFFTPQLMALFNASEQMLQIGVPALRLISLCFIPAALVIMMLVSFQALGYGKYSLIVAFLRQIVMMLPLAFILSRLLGVFGVWVAFPLAESVCFTASTALFIRLYRRNIRTLTPRAETADEAL